MTTKNVNADVQGQNANINGKWLEDQIEAECAKYGIKSVTYTALTKHDGKKGVADSKYGVLLKNVPYTNVFGANAIGEFVLYLYEVGPIRIECRCQNVRGTVQDKLPKLLEDCKCMPEDTVIIVLEGKGTSYNAKQWLKRAASSVQHKDIAVKNLEQFKYFLKRAIKSVAPAETPQSLVKRAIKPKVTKKEFNVLTRRA